MKLAYILTEFPCRSENFAIREMHALKEMGFEITVLAACAKTHRNTLLSAIKVFYRPHRFSSDAASSIAYLLRRYPSALFKLVSLIFRLVVSSPRDAATLTANLHTVAFFTRCLDRRRIGHIHAYFLSLPACIGLAMSVVTGRTFSIAAHARDIFVEAGAVEAKVLRADFVTVCTRSGLKYLQAKLPERHHQKLHLNYHGIPTGLKDIRRNQEQNDRPKSANTIIAAGRLVPKKGFDQLLKAFSIVIRQKANANLIILGDGPIRKQLTALAEEMAPGDNVHFFGWQEHEVTMRLIAEAAILAAPSVIAQDGDRDGIPNVILEAFAVGTPVIAGDLEPITEAVQHRKTGLCVSPGDPHSLACAIEELLDNSHLRRRLSQNAYEMVTRHFDVRKNVENPAKLFTEISNA